MNDTWSLAGVWNETLDIDNHRPYEPRDYIWASELGGSFYDRYWKMKGRVPTTPPNLRSKRKFNGGNLAEWIVEQILKRAQILQSSQEYITYEDGPMRVTGRADFVAGGTVQELSPEELSDLPESFVPVAEATLANLKEKHPDGLREVNIEVKSTSGMMFERYQEAPGRNHALQAFHYAFNTKRPTLLVYISRDDFRICEWIISPDSEKWKDIYDKDISIMAETIGLSEDDVTDIREELLVYDPETEKFSKNWKIEYSGYLTDYGFEIPEEYAKPAQSKALRLNNIIKRLKEYKEMSKANLKTIAECCEWYPTAEEIINNLKEKYSGRK